MQTRNKSQNLDLIEQKGLLRLIKLAMLMGQYSGRIEKTLKKEMLADIPHPLVIAKQRLTRSEYENVINTISDEKIFGVLCDAFKNELEGHYWGRLLFYIIKGGELINQNRQVILSNLPKIFYPTSCLSPLCSNELKFNPRDLQNNKKPVLRCKECKDSWAKARDNIESAINVTYKCFGSGEKHSIKTKIASLYQGYLSLCQYIDSEKTYQTRISKNDNFKGLDTENISLVCTLPDKFKNQATRKNALKEFNKWESSEPCLPSKYWGSAYKNRQITPFIDELERPLNSEFRVDSDSLITLKNLDEEITL